MGIVIAKLGNELHHFGATAMAGHEHTMETMAVALDAVSSIRGGG